MRSSTTLGRPVKDRPTRVPGTQGELTSASAQGNESNWIQTVAGKGWFILLRLYGRSSRGVAVIGMLPGILIAVALSLLDVARRSSWPHTAVLVQVPGTDTYRDSDHTADAQSIPGLLIYRFDAPLFFANASVLTEELAELTNTAESPVEMILIDAESIHDVDTTGVQSLEELIEDLQRDNITLAIARLRNAVRSILDAADLIDRIGEQNIYLEIDNGVQAFLRRTPPV